MFVINTFLLLYLLSSLCCLSVSIHHHCVTFARQHAYIERHSAFACISTIGSFSHSFLSCSIPICNFHVQSHSPCTVKKLAFAVSRSSRYSSIYGHCSNCLTYFNVVVLSTHFSRHGSPPS